MGKNTMIRKAIKGHLEQNPALEKYAFSNIIFTSGLSTFAVFWQVVAVRQGQRWVRFHEGRIDRNSGSFDQEQGPSSG
jgi:hypothetical protein